MIFGKKKKRMIDIGELQKRGKVKSPNFMPKDLATDKEGFVEVGTTKTSVSVSDDSVTSESTSSYIDVGTSASGSNDFSSESDGYNKREVDTKIQQLDTMIYKLEQRIELLERKAGVDPGATATSTDSAGSLIGW